MNKDAEMVSFATSFAGFPRVFFHVVKDSLAINAGELERKNLGGLKLKALRQINVSQLLESPPPLRGTVVTGGVSNASASEPEMV